MATGIKGAISKQKAPAPAPAKPDSIEAMLPTSVGGIPVKGAYTMGRDIINKGADLVQSAQQQKQLREVNQGFQRGVTPPPGRAGRFGKGPAQGQGQGADGAAPSATQSQTNNGDSTSAPSPSPTHEEFHTREQREFFAKTVPASTSAPAPSSPGSPRRQPLTLPPSAVRNSSIAGGAASMLDSDESTLAANAEARRRQDQQTQQDQAQRIQAQQQKDPNADVQPGMSGRKDPNSVGATYKDNGAKSRFGFSSEAEVTQQLNGKPAWTSLPGFEGATASNGANAGGGTSKIPSPQFGATGDAAWNKPKFGAQQKVIDQYQGAGQFRPKSATDQSDLATTQPDTLYPKKKVPGTAI
jgi:hypothetical protein